MYVFFFFWEKCSRYCRHQCGMRVCVFLYTIILHLAICFDIDMPFNSHNLFLLWLIIQKIREDLWVFFSSSFTPPLSYSGKVSVDTNTSQTIHITHHFCFFFYICWWVFARLFVDLYMCICLNIFCVYLYISFNLFWLHMILKRVPLLELLAFNYEIF